MFVWVANGFCMSQSGVPLWSSSGRRFETPYENIVPLSMKQHSGLLFLSPLSHNPNKRISVITQPLGCAAIQEKTARWQDVKEKECERTGDKERSTGAGVLIGAIWTLLSSYALTFYFLIACKSPWKDWLRNEKLLIKHSAGRSLEGLFGQTSWFWLKSQHSQKKHFWKILQI